MAVVGNRNQLTPLLLLCIISSAMILPLAEAQVTCTGLISTLLPCADYIFNGGAIPASCCGALKTVVDSLKTKQDRQSACECMKAGVAKATPDQLKRAQGLPSYCNVPLPFQISPDVNCAAIPIKHN